METLAADLQSALGDENERSSVPAPELQGRTLLVLYGTETGHSQEIAEEIADAAERLQFRTSVLLMNDVPLVSQVK